MVVKQRKPRLGRRPSPRLWEMVRSYTDDEWRQFKAFSEVYGKGSQQWRLLEFHRNQERYIPELEKETFADVALTSMRNTARNWLVRTSIRLGLLAVELEDLTREVDDLLRRGFPDVAMEHHEVAKRLATEQEEFGWLARLLKQELVLVKLLLTGKEREAAMLRVSEEAIANAKLQVLDAEIAAMEVRYLENPRARIIEEGDSNSQAVGDYFASDFYMQETTKWPVSFQIRRLKIDDLNHYFRGENEQSLRSAMEILRMMDSHGSIRLKMAEEHSKSLYRAFEYAIELGDKSLWQKTIHWMRECSPTTPNTRGIYLSRFISMLFRAGLNEMDWGLAEEAVQLWEANMEFFKPSHRSNAAYVIQMYLTAYYLASDRQLDARRAIATLRDANTAAMFPPHQAIWRIQHLITLLDEGDLRGLESYGTNYRRHLKKVSPSSPALQFVTILTRPSNLDSNEKLQEMLRDLLQILRPHEQSSDFTFKPFLYPLIKWAESRQVR